MISMVNLLIPLHFMSLKMKNRFMQPFLALMMILILIIYLLLLLLFQPVFWLGAIFWKQDTFNDMFDFLYKHIPEIPYDDK